MSTYKLPNIPSLRKQQLRLEFASLKTAPPPGVYVNISPVDPTSWSGVLFVQNGPYAAAILRFQLRFPPTYPDLPPVVTFTTDIFHPLIVPLTTYTFSTNSPDTDTVSATDEERLPPGGFSLRHGFPHWFGRARRSATNSSTPSRNVSGGERDQRNATPSAQSGEGSKNESGPETPKAPKTSGEQEVSSPKTPARVSPAPTGAPYSSTEGIDVPVLKVLNYIRSTFDDEAVLDSVPLEAAGNPGAWHAWRSHRGLGNREGEDGSGAQVKRGSPQARRPGEWNWEGVWEKRVQTGIETSYLESVLFGSSMRGFSDDLIRFIKLDNDILARTKEQIVSTRDSSEVASILEGTVRSQAEEP
ncbi:hypothetical protein AJ79_09188 [Helicocarpus griseus UAMH5409]|uniref:UBC core domain-containing protein n=1 Tax=Helicocarpus griseus UAMH5409 TaxID=1447875 RepID=A0A2B7WLQ3_9EURO|nr:hypothetical protein AJ79_09188 [Helicocarpus griseus UAMH5409]